MTSNFRLRDSINTVETLIDRAIELGHSAVAITEHDTISSSVRALRYYKKIKEKNPDFKVILGNEIYLTRNGLNAQNFDRERDRYYHFVLLAKNEKGHEQIRELSTLAWGNAYTYRGMMRVPTYYQNLWDVVGKEPGNLIATTACLGGIIGTQLLKYEQTKDEELLERIKKWILQMNELFGQGNFFLEMQPSHNKEQIYVNKKIVEISKELNVPLIINLDAHYLSKEDRPIHKAFLTAQQGDRETDEFYMTTYLMDTEEILSFMKPYLPMEAIEEAFNNGWKVREMCEDYELEKPLRIPYIPLSPQEPDKKLLEKWAKPDSMLYDFAQSKRDSDRHLAAEILLKIENDPQYQNQETLDEIEVNLDVIKVSSKSLKADWAAYLLNVKDYIDIAWNEGNTLVGAARGSGGGFLLLNMLGITQINPLREKTKTFFWRFLNPERVSPLDIDFDIEASKRAQVYGAYQKNYGVDRVSKVLTLRTEKAKSAILTAARGLGVDIETAQHLSSLLVSERGILRTLSQSYYGDPEEGIAPNREFVRQMDENPKVWEVAQRIEGLIAGIGSHAGGIIFTDEPFYKSTALMRTANGDIVTQFDLHTAESVGLIKVDALSVEALDRIHTTLDLLMDYGYVEPEPTLRETYEKVIGVYNLERDNPEMWDMVYNHEIQSLFQMEQQSGIQGISLTKPRSVDELAVLNSVIRLMASTRGAEQPLNKFARFKSNPKLWEEEMDSYGLTEREKALLRPHLESSYGICETQEKFMQLVQIPEVGGHSLLWADRLRKAVGKKDPVEYDKLTEEFYETLREKKLSENLGRYVWEVLVATSRGYGFNSAHTLGYSIIGLQEMNLAFRYPRIFWDTACLIVDSGGAEEEDYWTLDDEGEIVYTSGPDAFEDDDDDDTEEGEEVPINKPKEKAKPRSIDFGKIATAIGQIQGLGIQVLPPDINDSQYTFTPNVKKNTINYGLSGISMIGEDLVQRIIANRPYKSLDDFINKVKATKPQIVKLIKAGAFDSFGDRVAVMEDYIDSIAQKRKQLTIANVPLLAKEGLLPPELDFELRVYNFNKYLKTHKSGEYYLLNNIALNFYQEHFDYNLLVGTQDSETGLKILASKWDKLYQKGMDPIRAFLKKEKSDLILKLDERAYQELWDKYASGNLSAWEMDSVSFYSHEHELSSANLEPHGVVDFFELSEEPEVDSVFYAKGRPVTLYKIERIAGSVLDRNKDKGMVTILTTSGVVKVRIFGALFAHYNRQLSEIVPETGRKRIIEKSVFTRGNKIIVSGIRQGDMFIAKKYARTPFHLIEKIVEVKEDGDIVTTFRSSE